jgi:Fe-S-cluster containining protein
MADVPGVCLKSTPMSVGSQLCTQCGLCCTGALHDKARAEPDELEGLKARGMHIIAGEQSWFSLPCPRLQGTSCGIYADRPQVCSGYRCGLLRQVEDGATEISDAIAKVREARRLFEAVVRLLPPGMSLPEARALPCDPERAPATITPDRYPLLVLQVLALTRYLDQHFRHSEEGPLLLEELLTMDGSTESSPKATDRHV